MNTTNTETRSPVAGHPHLTAPQRARVWTVNLSHPGAGSTDADCDAYADLVAPAGWSRHGSTVQGRDRKLRPVVVVTYVRWPAPGEADAWQRLTGLELPLAGLSPIVTVVQHGA